MSSMPKRIAWALMGIIKTFELFKFIAIGPIMSNQMSFKLFSQTFAFQLAAKLGQSRKQSRACAHYDIFPLVMDCTAVKRLGQFSFLFFAPVMRFHSR